LECIHFHTTESPYFQIYLVDTLQTISLSMVFDDLEDIGSNARFVDFSAPYLPNPSFRPIKPKAASV